MKSRCLSWLPGRGLWSCPVVPVGFGMQDTSESFLAPLPEPTRLAGTLEKNHSSLGGRADAEQLSKQDWAGRQGHLLQLIGCPESLEHSFPLSFLPPSLPLSLPREARADFSPFLLPVALKAPRGDLCLGTREPKE